VKFLSAFGSFFGRRFAVDPDEEANADAELEWFWISDTQHARMVCPFCKAAARWAPPMPWESVMVPRVELELVNGFLSWRPPP
jgi:hypothetical protein